MVFARPLRFNQRRLQPLWLSILLEARLESIVAVPGSSHSYAGAKFVDLPDADSYSTSQTLIFA